MTILSLSQCITKARVAEKPPSGARPLRELEKYPVERFIFVDKKSNPFASAYIALHNARNLPSEVPDYQVPHKHGFDEFYFFIGRNHNDLTGLAGQIKFEGVRYEISSPSGVFVPAGAVHEYKVTKSEGYVVILYKNLDYGHIGAEPDDKGGDFSGNIVKPEIRLVLELRYHNDSAPGDRYVFFDEKRTPEVKDFYANVRNANDIKDNQPKYVDIHAHRCDSYHLFIGNELSLSGLKAEMRIGNETAIIDSPAAVFIPAGASHCYRLIGGSGQFFSVVFSSNYNNSLI